MSVKLQNSGILHKVYCGTNTSHFSRDINIASVLPQIYTRLTADDFLFDNIGVFYSGGTVSDDWNKVMTKSYDNINGILTVGQSRFNYAGNYMVVAKYDTYAIYI